MTKIAIWTDQLNDQLIKLTNHLNLNEYSYKIVNKWSDDLNFFPLLVVFDSKKMNLLLSSIKSLNHKVIFLVNDELDEALLSKMTELEPFIFSIIDLSKFDDDSYVVVRKYLETNFNLEQQSLIKQLEEIKDSTNAELKSIKSLYERIVRPRTDKFTYMKVTSKFSSGLSSGGEFFDTFNNQESIFVYFKTTNYMDSSELISEVDRFKFSTDSQNIDQLVTYFEKFKNNITYCFLKLDLSERKIIVKSRGNHRLFINNLELSLTSEQVIKIDSFDKVFFVSEGYLENWNKFYQNKSFANELKAVEALDNINVLGDLFYMLHKEKKNSYYDYDSVISIFDFDFERNVEKFKK